MAELKLSKNQNIHIIGGGGVGMSALGMLLLHLGYKVSSSDKNGGKYLEKLGAAGAVVWTGSDPQKIPAKSLVFYSSAIPARDLERKWAIEQKLEIYPRHNLLNAITSQYYTIAVSGTHGKTTTTGWIAFLLEKAGLDPNAMVGGTLVQWDSNIRLGHGKIDGKPVLVIEADESDESFLHIHSAETMVTNVELDHVDNYASLDDVKNRFSKFISNSIDAGGVFFPSFEVRNLLQPGMKSFEKISGLCQSISIKKSEQSIVYKNENFEKIFNIGLSGEHNLWNAFAVLVFGLYHELPLDAISEALLQYRGVERRMQILGSVETAGEYTIRVIDDYAHHPTEIKMVLQTLARKDRGLIVVWEPHRISRFLHFYNDFVDVFENSLDLKKIIVMNVFDAAGERQMPQYSSFESIWPQWTSRVFGGIEMKGQYEKIFSLLASEKSDTDIVFLGAGNSSEYAHDFLAEAMKRIHS